MIYIQPTKKIEFTRGDDVTITVSIKTASGTAYTMTSADRLIFTVRQKPVDTSDVLLRVTSALGSNNIVFSYADTKDMAVGKYSADIQLMTGENSRGTIWPELSDSQKYSKSNWENFGLMAEVTKE